jgi:protein-disulfide isomerase
LLTVVAIWLVLFGQNQMLGRARLARTTASATQGFGQCRQILDRVKGDTDWLIHMWETAPRCDLAAGPDGPARIGEQPTPAPLDVVVFSDFECGSCKRLAGFLAASVEPLFGGNMRTVFKHYPLHSECNPFAVTQKHGQACMGAAMAEAARSLGGDAAFWRTHDYLFEHQDRLKRGQIEPDEIAKLLRVEPREFLEKAESDAVRLRIREDAKQAVSCGLTGTPLVLVSGRRVDVLARGEVDFWDRLADMYWQGRNEPRPESTRLLRDATTPSNPGQQGAP